MHGCVVGIALRQEVPLRARAQNPQHRLHDGEHRYRFAIGAGIQDVFSGAPLQNLLPLLMAQAPHVRTNLWTGIASLNSFESCSKQRRASHWRAEVVLSAGGFLTTGLSSQQPSVQPRSRTRYFFEKNRANS